MSGSDQSRRRWIRLLTAACILHSAASPSVEAGSHLIANFWLSESPSAEPETPTVFVLAGSTATIEVLARPASGETLTGFSLNLVAEQPAALDFLDIVVHNPQLDASATPLMRHQLVFDSAEGLFHDDDLIHGFQGVSILNDVFGLPDGAGIGPACVAADSYCTATAGADVWHVATVAFQAAAAGTSTELYLQLSDKGLLHAAGDPLESAAVFGLSDDQVAYWDPAVSDDRNENIGLPDAVIQVVAQLPSADFDGDGLIDGVDFLTWQDGFPNGATQATGDANGDGVANGDDLVIWQDQFGAGAAAGATIAIAPEPCSLGAATVLTLISIVCVRVPRRSPG